MKTYYRIKVEHDANPQNPREDDNLGTMLCWHRRYILGDENQWKRGEPADAITWLIREVNPGFEYQLQDWYDEQWALRCEPHNEPQRRAAERELMADYDARIDDEMDRHYTRLPLFLYDHSGITMNTRPFSCPWDSGQVGFIYLSHARANAELGGPEFTGQDRAWNADKERRVIEVLTCEVTTYNQYITGNVYGFTVETFHYEFEIPLDTEVDPNDDGLDWTHHDSCWGFHGTDAEVSGLCDHVDGFLKAPAKVAQGCLNEWVLVTQDTAEAPANG